LAVPAQLTDNVIQLIETRVAPSANEIVIEAPTIQTIESSNRNLDSESPPIQSGEETVSLPLSPLHSSDVIDDRHEQRPLEPVLPIVDEEGSGSSTIDADTSLTNHNYDLGESYVTGEPYTESVLREVDGQPGQGLPPTDNENLATSVLKSEDLSEDHGLVRTLSLHQSNENISRPDPCDVVVGTGDISQVSPSLTIQISDGGLTRSS
jgi:hypothetical protein